MEAHRIYACKRAGFSAAAARRTEPAPVLCYIGRDERYLAGTTLLFRSM
jgi:hypothetical protein